MWICQFCKSTVDANFELCWKCGTSRTGERDPEFLPADDMGPIADPLIDHNAELTDVQIPAGADFANSPGTEMVECYQAYSLMEAKFLADQLVAAGIPAISDTIDMQDALGVLDGNPRVYCHAQDFDRARLWLENFETRRNREHPARDSSST